MPRLPPHFPVKTLFQKMILENATTSPHPFLRQPQGADLEILSSFPNPTRSQLTMKEILLKCQSEKELGVLEVCPQETNFPTAHN